MGLGLAVPWGLGVFAVFWFWVMHWFGGLVVLGFGWLVWLVGGLAGLLCFGLLAGSIIQILGNFWAGWMLNCGLDGGV